MGFGMGYGGFGVGFDLFSIIFPLFFLVFIVIFAVVAIKGISQWNKNNHSPKLTVPATVVSKRTNVTHHRHGGTTGLHHHHHTTHYYATFQVESGDRMEFAVGGQEYGMIIEGDQGKLTFQGTRYLGFERL